MCVCVCVCVCVGIRYTVSCLLVVTTDCLRLVFTRDLAYLSKKNSAVHLTVHNVIKQDEIQFEMCDPK